MQEQLSHAPNMTSHPQESSILTSTSVEHMVRDFHVNIATSHFNGKVKNNDTK